MSDSTGFYRLIEDMHQSIRDFVEKEFPGYKVTRIRLDAETEYHPPLLRITDDPYKMQWPPIAANIRFKVDLRELVNEIACDVYALDDGTLRMGDRSITVPASPILRRRT